MGVRTILNVSGRRGNCPKKINLAFGSADCSPANQQ